MGSKLRSSDLERGSSSGVGTTGIGIDTATFVPSSAPSSSHPSACAASRRFHAFKEKCALKVDVFSKFKDRFQFPDETKVRLPRKGEKACALPYGEVYFYKAAFSCDLRFPIHPFIMELLHHLNIAPG